MTEERVYEAFGELVYAVAKADGSVQPEEDSTLKEILKKYSWGEQVAWSFEYEKNKNRSIVEAYNRSLDVFAEYGPFREYNNFFEVLEKVAAASGGIDENERSLIQRFKTDLINRLMNDERIK
jgi:uncharacterized tellurite resistance protein B-like protein